LKEAEEMANAFILNQVPTGYGAALSLLVEMLVSAGWTYRASGDGLAGYNASGKVFSGTGAGALGWNNSGAWARLQDPGARREFVFQHNAAGGARIKYSPTAKFAAGTPSATVTPSATDEKYLRGGGTDAAPTYGATWFNTAVVTGLVKFQGRANDTAPYGFWFAGAQTPGGAPSTGLVMDPVASVPEDPDPVVLHIGAASAFKIGALGQSGPMSTAGWSASGGANQGTWGFLDVAKTAFQHVMPGYYLVGSSPPNGGNIGGSSDNWAIQATGLIENPFNSKHEALPIPWIRATFTSLTPPLGLKGWSTLMRWTTIARTSFSDTMDNKNWICVGFVWLPWDGATTPTV
jgi:hypothetical protein